MKRIETIAKLGFSALLAYAIYRRLQ